MDGDDLYGRPLERFVPERAALARELRSAGRREQAAAVAALRKPSIAAWAVNQLVRGQDHAIADLLAAGDALRDAQAGVLAGRAEGRALRAATERERAAVDTLLEKARGLLNSEGQELSPVILDRVAETLHAAALGDDARRLIGDGRLERELRHVGLGAGIGAQSPPTRPTPVVATKPKQRPASSADKPRSQHRGRTSGRQTDRAGGADDRADAVKLAARERAKARKTAQADEAQARRQADRATRAGRAAEQRRERAAEALQRADQELARARADAQAAADAHDQARQRLEALDRSG